MFLCGQVFLVLFSIFLLLFPVNAIRSFPDEVKTSVCDQAEKNNKFDVLLMQFVEAPEYQNGLGCPEVAGGNELLLQLCDPLLVHVAMTLDPEYLRGTIAAVHSVIRHTSCPENVFFHFIASDSGTVDQGQLTKTVVSAFPSLRFKVYVFKESMVRNLISSSIRQALDNPLNYARSYLAEMLEPCVKRVIYLDSDVIVVDDIQNLWRVSLTGSRAIGAPEYCHADFRKYFSSAFWSDPEHSRAFSGKAACYFNTGVMLMDLERWRDGEYTREIEKWMRIQKERRIYDLGSLPPFLLVFAGDVEAIDHRWNQHGLGGDNVVSSCRPLHPGPVSLLHWSGKEKPWSRLDEKKPCPVDSLWAPYDLYEHQQHSQFHHQGQAQQ